VTQIYFYAVVLSVGTSYYNTCHHEINILYYVLGVVQIAKSLSLTRNNKGMKRAVSSFISFQLNE
jgi:hypothetical protein